MGIRAIEAALDRLRDDCDYACVHDEPKDNGHASVYELKDSRLENYRGFLRVEVTDGPEWDEIYLTWSMPVAVVEDLGAAPALLMQNLGGLKNSSFYFSLSRQGDNFFLIAESKANDRTIDEDLIFWRIFNWFHAGPFMTTWRIPEGVTSVNPGYEAAD